MIAIVDYGVNNLASVRNAFMAVGGDVVTTADPDEIRAADGVVLPGIGAASAGMRELRQRGLDSVVEDIAASGKPLLGICLGMQLLFEWSDEGDAACLGLLRGRVALLRGDIKVPQIGWNQVEARDGSDVWQGMGPNPYFYFVHSYICEPSDEKVVAGNTSYGGVTFCSAVAHGPIWGTQFHPERSSRTGLQLIRNFVETCRV